MRHRREYVGFHPFAIRQHSLLVAARAEVARLAREGEDEAMPAMVAVDPGEAVLRISAGDESPDDVFFDTAAKAAARSQFRRMPGSALAERRIFFVRL